MESVWKGRGGEGERRKGGGKERKCEGEKGGKTERMVKANVRR